MRNDDWNDRGQHRGLWVLASLLLPDTLHVAEEPQSHEAVGAALVLEQDVEQHPLSAEHGREQQIAPQLFQGWVDEAPGDRRQRRPLDARRERVRQRSLKQAGCVLGLREHEAKEMVVRLHLAIGVDAAHGAPVTGPCCFRGNRRQRRGGTPELGDERQAESVTESDPGGAGGWVLAVMGAAAGTLGTGAQG